MKSVLLFLCAVSCIVSCTNPAEQKASTLVDDFYTQYQPGDYRLADTSRLSAPLNALLKKAALLQQQDSSRLKALQSTDKPLMIEGDIFTSLYEGANKHAILQTMKQDNQTLVLVSFSNTHYGIHNWVDTAVLVKEPAGWKIDNVLYDAKQGSSRSLQQTLLNFLSLSSIK